MNIALGIIAALFTLGLGFFILTSLLDALDRVTRYGYMERTWWHSPLRAAGYAVLAIPGFGAIAIATFFVFIVVSGVKP